MCLCTATDTVSVESLSGRTLPKGFQAMDVNCLLKTCNIILASAILHFKDVWYVFIGHLSQQPGKSITIRHIYTKSLTLLSAPPLRCFPGGNQQSVCFWTHRASRAICNTLIPGNKNIRLIELFNCPLNPAECPCCCLMVCLHLCVCVCVLRACVRSAGTRTVLPVSGRGWVSEHSGSFCV